MEKAVVVTGLSEGVNTAVLAAVVTVEVEPSEEAELTGPGSLEEASPQAVKNNPGNKKSVR